MLLRIGFGRQNHGHKVLLFSTLDILIFFVIISQKISHFLSHLRTKYNNKKAFNSFLNLTIPSIFLEPINSSILSTLHNTCKSISSSFSNSIRAIDNKIAKNIRKYFYQQKPCLTLQELAYSTGEYPSYQMWCPSSF